MEAFMSKNLSPVVESCVERVKEGLERALTGVMEWSLYPMEEDPISELGRAEKVFLMAVSALAHDDAEVSGMLLKEIQGRSVIPRIMKYMAWKMNAEWEVPKEMFDRALRFAHVLEASGLFVVPPELQAYLAELAELSTSASQTEEHQGSAPPKLSTSASQPEEPQASTAPELLNSGSQTEEPQASAAPELPTSSAQLQISATPEETPAAAQPPPPQPRMSRLGERSQLWEGVEKDDGQLVEGAVLSGADVNEVRAAKGHRTPLALAASKGRVGAVRALIRLGAQLEVGTGAKKRTALHLASAGGHVAIVRELLAAGADVGAEGSSKFTPLHLASLEGHLDVVRELLAAGANLEAEDNYKSTPLHWASANGQKAVVLELLEAGANVGAVTGFGWTPLHEASYSGHLATVRVLMEVGAADFNAKDCRGDTPLWWAEDEGHTAVAQYLRSVGGTK